MFIFSINYFPFISIVCKSLNILYVSVSVTCPMVEIFNKTIVNPCNKVFLFDKKQYESIVDSNPDGIFYLPLGAAVDRVDSLLGNDSEYDFDVSFVGSLYSEKDPFLSLKLKKEQRSDFEEAIQRQILCGVSGQDLLEKEISNDQVEAIRNAAEDFYSSDLSIQNLDRFVAVNNYLSPHMTYLERVEILNHIGGSFGKEKIHLFTNSSTDEINEVTCHGGVATLTEMPYVFRKSRINLNLTTRSIKTGIPQRVWDVLACKGFLISNYQEELPQYFILGKHLVAYESRQELIELIGFYLEHEDERREIAERGYAVVKEKGKVLDRVVSIIKTIAG